MKAGGILAAALLCLASPSAVASLDVDQTVSSDAQDPPAIRGGALDTDCSHVGERGTGYQFIVTCPGEAKSPDSRLAVVQAGDESGHVYLADATGKLLDDLPSLMDSMPFVLVWAPRGNWFFANHYLGSGQERLKVFEVVNGNAVERSAIFAEATRTMVGRYPCLARGGSVAASGWRWSRDGRRIALVAYARPDACHFETRPGLWEPRGTWQSLWMIGEAETGRIDPASVRVRPGGVGAIPTDGSYALF